ncbi:MAG: galactokinase [Planctomycetes bacterium]|nr:galactokinase [Planctomycetota bacterium]MCP4770104.1 galactokinase [Planctomycetota bacterium]MCP4860748.1 galactokinase [Planctomycetota bacterium]
MSTKSRPLDLCLERFRAVSKAEAHAFFAPGRANLMGAHMDYNGGVVMPVALSKGTYALAGLRQDGMLRLESMQFPGEVVEVPLAELKPGRTDGWSSYVEGGLWIAMQRWGQLPGLDLILNADLPMAKGLSSSASVECVGVLLVAKLLGIKADVDEMIHLAHGAETQYVGVRCGILDQTAIFLGEANSILRFDCLELSREHMPLDSAEASIAICDTGVARELASSAFNQRVAECTRALTIFQEQIPGVTCLRDVSHEEFERHIDLLAPALARRAQHVIDEVQRTREGSAALRRGEVAGFGAQMTAAHVSLRDLYEVSSPELDAMVEASVEVDGCYGSRLTGAGFGGCTAALVHPAAQAEFEKHVTQRYAEVTGRTTNIQWFAPAGGPVEIEV